MKKLVGIVAKEERDELKDLFERKNGLLELINSINDSLPIYDKIVMDLGKTSTKMQNWWSKYADFYKWEQAENGHWEIDFETCENFLVS